MANKQTSPSLSTGEYIEPAGFKGWPGEFVIKGRELETADGKNYIAFADTDSNESDFNEKELATIILLSQSKELVKCLQKIIKCKDACMSTQDLFHVLKAIDESREVLQKAIPNS